MVKINEIIDFLATQYYYIEYCIDTSMYSDLDIVLKLSRSDAKLLKKYIEFGIDINAVDVKDGGTALHITSWLGNKIAVENLIENNINVNKKCLKDLAALDVALLSEQSEIASYLIEKGAYISPLSFCIIELGLSSECKKFLQPEALPYSEHEVKILVSVTDMQAIDH